MKCVEQLVVSSLRSVQEKFTAADMEVTKPPVSKNQVYVHSFAFQS
jgi:hypothetical protein